MNITFWLNGKKKQAEVEPSELLLDFLRKNSCYSVKRGCETANCGLCTVLMDGRRYFPVPCWLPVQTAKRS